MEARRLIHAVSSIGRKIINKKIFKALRFGTYRISKKSNGKLLSHNRGNVCARRVNFKPVEGNQGVGKAQGLVYFSLSQMK